LTIGGGEWSTSRSDRVAPRRKKPVPIVKEGVCALRSVWVSQRIEKSLDEMKKDMDRKSREKTFSGKFAQSQKIHINP
jgi:hypothetical protein